MPVRIFQTEDGSFSLKHLELGESYHSKFGAYNESRHIFMESALNTWLNENHGISPVRIFEMGFGTGLNAILAMDMAEQKHRKILYHSIELYPVDQTVYENLHYEQLVSPDYKIQAKTIQTSAWNENIPVSTYFELRKQTASILDISLEAAYYDVLFFDAFSPDTQADLWTEAVFSKLFQASKPGAVLTTYCSKGEVRRALSKAGFQTRKIAGPKGKRDITFAQKPKL